MSRTWLIVAVVCLVGALRVWADNVLYRYEGDVLPYDPAAGWLIFDACEGVCSVSVGDGHFMADWIAIGDAFNYTLIYARAPAEPPPTLWVEWRFHSTNRFIPTRPDL